MNRALVLGLGESGLAMARALAQASEVRVADTRQAPPMLDALREQLPQVAFSVGFDVSLLDQVSQVAVSPGLSLVSGEAADLLREARARGIEVVGEIELFARALMALQVQRGYQPQIVAVTGTNGKTTTTRLAALLIASTGRSVMTAGNISPTALDALQQVLEADALPEVWVLELSSFQLATTESLQCTAAAVLNIAPDHLDWHGSAQAYAQAKARIFSAQTLRVLCRDDEAVMAMADPKADTVTFGSDAPAQGDGYGLLTDSGMTWLSWAEDLAAVEGKRRRKGAQPQTPEIHVHRLMPMDALRIRGKHNALNALAALALARAVGCPLAPMLHALRDYAGEPHRIAPVAHIQGVDYYDDSKGTNVAATLAALEALGGVHQKLAVILGGDGKGQDFAPLAAPLARCARAVALIGRDADAIAEALAGADYPSQRCASLEQAVQYCAQQAQAGDAVLLSPACASLDMFRHYAHRAEVFCAAVRELALAQGQPC